MTLPTLLSYDVADYSFYEYEGKFYSLNCEPIEKPAESGLITPTKVDARSNEYKKFVGTISSKLEAHKESIGSMTEYTFGDRVLLIGPTGTGKTHKFHELANTLFESGELDFAEKITVSDGFEDTDFLAYIVPTEKGGVKYDERSIIGCLREASKGKKVAICIDEMNRGSRSFMNFILTFLDSVEGGNYVLNNFVFDEKIVIPSENLVLFATMNLGNKYTGTNSVDEALLDRFTRVNHVGYNVMYEDELIENSFGSLNDKIRNVVNSVRTLFTNGSIRSTISTRGIKVWASRYTSLSSEFQTKEMSIENVTRSFNETLLMRLISMDDYGNPNESEKLLVMKTLNDNGFLIV